jgi:elongation factor Ts
MDVAKIRELRERTGAGVLDCKNALVSTKGNIDKAIDYLRKKGIAKAEKRLERKTEEGIVEAYIHPGAKLGVLVELSCETDFVAHTEELKRLARDIAMQVAAVNPICISRNDIPEERLKREREIYEAQAKELGKPDKVIEKIVASKMENFYKEACLLEQSFIKQPDITIDDLIKEHIAKIGENIKINRFVRFKIGEKS